ncbi:NH(3)-dependent NAD(+) synthetase [subsurface metagenome]|nr:NAD+ synthase [Dehalococcoidia bacterium]
MNIEALAEKLTSWIRDEITARGSLGAVLGMSGGVDSSVVAVLCKRAFPENTMGVMMPCHSNPDDKAHAQAVADKFDIPTVEVVLDSIYEAFLKKLPEFKDNPELKHLARANLKPRLRMVALYYITNQLRYMVVGSSNRSEVAIGYFTKYGDGGVDIMPLGNLVKEQVKELARFLGIPQPIIDKPPSAGLWDGQTDESEMGISYEALDSFILTGEASDEVRKKIEKMMAGSAHKRSLPPIPEF